MNTDETETTARDAAVDYVTNEAYKCLDPTSFTDGDDLYSACEEAVDVALEFARRDGYALLSDRDQHGIITGLEIWLKGEME